jgi:hypothetical protein
MLVLGKGGFDDGVALPRPAQTFAPDEIIESFLDAKVHSALLTRRSPHGKRKAKQGKRGNRQPRQKR